MMSDSESRLEFVGQLGEEFLARFRRGECPAISEYADRHPQFADEIREVFPALLAMEGVAGREPAGAANSGPVKLRHDAFSRLGDYRIIREVGRGGMGIVYEAEQESLGRRVALKVLPQNLLAGDRHKQRFEREAKAAGRLHHTNIVPVFGVGEQDGLSYYVMQFIPGLGLDAVLDELVRSKAAEEPSRLASGDVELRVSRRSDASAADVARSLIDATYIPHSSANLASHVTASSASGRSDLPTIDSAVDDPSPPAAHPDAASQRTVPDSRLAAERSGPAAGKLSDSFALSGSLGPSGSATEPEVGAQRRRQNYWHSVAQIGVQVASALHYAHGQGILHRDIKPGNLLLDLRGAVWVTDFGLAKSNDQADITHSGDVLGTLRYMPPEAFEGTMDPRSDVYSLGLTLYELLALKPAFDDRDRHKLIRQVTTAEAPPLESLNPEIPRDLATIVHKAIDRDSARRYQTALDFQLDLARFMADEAVQARPLSFSERGWRWCRHNRALAALSSVLIVALTAFGMGSTFAYYREFTHRREIEEKNATIVEALGRAKAATAAETDAKDDATRKLYRSLVDQARANRLSRRIGQRLKSLELLTKSARMARAMSLTEAEYLELRCEAVACLVLPDIKITNEGHPWPIGSSGIAFTAALDRYVSVDREGTVSIHRTSDDLRLWSVSVPENGESVPVFSPDGRFVAVWALINREDTVRVWRLDGPQPRLIVDKARAYCPA